MLTEDNERLLYYQRAVEIGGQGMKVLFLSNTAGQGHRSTADALMNSLRQAGAECRIIDTYKYLNPALYRTVANGYLIATAMIPETYGKFYRMYEKRDKNDSKHSLTNVANSIMAIKFKKFIDTQFKPDVIVCTHIFSAQLVNAMKLDGQLDVPIIGIVTDYTIHPFWQNVSAVDYIVIASELLAMQAEEKGISPSKLLPLGIPIDPKFCKKLDKAQARAELGIDPGKFTLLLMSGSMGHGNLVKVLESIDKLPFDFQVLVVCGNNLRAKRRCEEMHTAKRNFVFGFVNNVDVMMDASDCIITKPGGLTSSEALAKLLPIVMINPIPGQEERNVEFMLNNGLAVNVTETFPIGEALYQLFYYPAKLENMRENIKLVGKPNAAKDITDFILRINEKHQ